MNRYPLGKPPQWWSPKPSLFWMNFWRPVRRYHQKRKERIRRIDVIGLDQVKRAIRAKQGVLIAGNHPGHADHLLLFKALQRLHRRCFVMTTWQVFQMATPLERLQYRQHGCFSVDRDGADRRAFKQSVDVLADSSDPLVIFPEGEVYHLNERVAPFREGPATIALMAVRRSGRPVSCFPCALKYHYVKDPTPQLEGVMDRVEMVLGWTPRRELSLTKRIEAFGREMLAIKEARYLGTAREGDLEPRRICLMDEVLRRVEARYNGNGGAAPGAIPERVKRLRQLAIKRQCELGPFDKPTTDIGKDLEDLFFVTQLYSYPADYLAEHPTVERVAETIDKLEEDVLGAETASIRGTRRATITFGEPIVIREPGDRESVRRITDELQGRVQRLLFCPESRQTVPNGELVS